VVGLYVHILNTYPPTVIVTVCLDDFWLTLLLFLLQSLLIALDGYQITGIANRTTIADGNTWNHEHIALLGRTLTAPEKEAHRIARHLADYVLVWAGGGGDDVAKSPHLRRIANSVYRGLCDEPTCREFGFYVSASRASYVCRYGQRSVPMPSTHCLRFLLNVE
jgi:hypothetical protein